MIMVVEFSGISGFFWRCSDRRDEQPSVNDTTEMWRWPLYHLAVHSQPVSLVFHSLSFYDSLDENIIRCGMIRYIYVRLKSDDMASLV